MSLIDKIRLIPETASSMASDVDALFYFMTLTFTIITLVLMVLIGYFGVRYRRKSENEVPHPEHPNKWVEIFWSAVLFVLLMVIFFWGTHIYVGARRPPVNALEIDVMGKQWMWKIQHPGGQREINELHVPVNRPVKLTMTSQDVIHSFGIPAFRITQDVLPGAYTTQWCTATKVGEFHLFCREYCGTEHSQMIGKVVVMEERDYQAWLAGRPVDDGPVDAGAKLLAAYGCNQCHGLNAPTLAGLYKKPRLLEDGTTVIADEAYIRESILYPHEKIVKGYPRLMPSYRGQLNEEQVTTLVSYIKTLGAAVSDGKPAGIDAAGPASQPVNGVSPNTIRNVPPAPQLPSVGQRPAGGEVKP